MPATDSPNTGSLSGTTTGVSPMRSHEFEAHDINPQLMGSSTSEADEDRSGGAFRTRASPSDVAGDIKQRASQAAHESYQQARQFTNEALEKARHQLRESGSEVTQRAREVLDYQKQQFCHGLDHAAQAVHAAAHSMEERDAAGVARYAHMAGDGLGRVHEYLCAAGVDDVAQDIRHFVRQRPELVLGGLFIAGLALARLMKADRPIGPRGRPPQGADEGLWRDVYRSQFDDGAQFGARAGAWGDFDDSDVGFNDGGQRNAPGVAGYNPSGGYASDIDDQRPGAGEDYGKSFATTTARESEQTRSFPDGAAGVGEAACEVEVAEMAIGDDGIGGRDDRNGAARRRQGHQKGDWQ